MSKTRNGKIARLPHQVREELNRRIRDGQEGKALVEWMNGLEEVRAVLRRDFGGGVIREQNLSEWRKGGYQEWLRRQDLLSRVGDLAADAGRLREAGGMISDHLACILAARFAQALMEWDGTGSRDATRELHVLRRLCETVSDLRRGDHSAAKLEIERERVQLARLEVDKFMNEEIERRLQQPDMKSQQASAMEHQLAMQERIRHILGVSPSHHPHFQRSKAADEHLVCGAGI